MRKLDDVIDALPTRRRENVRKRTRRAVERVALAELRRIAGLSQAELARRMGVRQPTVSQIESQSDLKLSTLAGLVASLGGTMRIVVRIPQGEFVIGSGRASALAIDPPPRLP